MNLITFILIQILLYDALHVVEFKNKEQYEEDIIKQVNLKLEELIRLLKPNNIIYIAFDGLHLLRN